MQSLPDQNRPDFNGVTLPGGPRSMLAITLQCGPGGAEVQSVEFHTGDVITRCAFKSKRQPLDVLDPALAETVERLAEEASAGIGIISMPDFSLALPGIVLTKARIMVSRARHALRYVNIRFLRCFGNTASVFAPQTRPWQVGHDQSAQIAAETLERVFMPLRNFASHLDAVPEAAGPAGPLADALAATRQRIGELELHYQMLSDFLAAQEPQAERRSTEAIARLASAR